MATVLVVDDRATNREITRTILDHGGHRVLEAAGGQQALQLAWSEAPDVVVADVLMPGMDGYQFVRALQAEPQTAGIPVLLYTANYRPDEAGPLAEAYGVSRVLAKSADPLDLLAAVDEALRSGPAPQRPADTGLAARHLQAVNAKLLEKVQALDESEARFATIAQLSPVGIAICDPAGRATYVNPRLAEITQTPAADLLGGGWLACLPVGHRDRLGTPADWADDTLRYRGRVVLAGDQPRWLSTAVRQLADDDNRVIGYVATVDDVTALVDEQRRHAAERAQEAEARRRIGERYDSLARLSGGIAHDFNNLLNVVLSFCDFAREAVLDAVGAPLSADRAEAVTLDLDQVARAGRRAADLAHQLLTFGGREPARPTAVDVNAVLDEVRGMIEGTAGNQLTVTADLDPSLRPVHADGGQLSRVLLSLAVNARDATPDGGVLSLRTSAAAPTDGGPAGSDLPAGEYVHIEVTDNGRGMSPEDAQRATEPFFTTKPAGRGTGLGLATAYGIVKQAGGDLVIDSAVGRGTAVHLYLPATDDPPPAAVPDRTGGAAVAGATILVAEDEDGVREAAVRILTGAGYRVLAAADGADALAVAQQNSGGVDAVLTDVVMPRMSGPQLAEALRRIEPAAPVLYMSGFAGPLMTAQGMLPAGVTVLSKPFTKAGLLEALHRALTAAVPPGPPGVAADG